MHRVFSLWWRLVAFGFRLLYNEMAFTYDLVSRVVSLGAWPCWQQAALLHIGEDAVSVLELAHGTGSLQVVMQGRPGWQVTGYDLSPSMGRIASRKLRKQGLPVRLARGRAQSLPFPDAGFDAVVCTFPTAFILEPATLREIVRVLRPQGRLVVVFNGVLVGGGPLRVFLEWLYRVTGQRAGGTFDPAAYLQPYGFAASLRNEACPRSVARVLVARKKP